MCSRYFLDADGNVIAYAFRVPPDERIRPRFNIAPGQEAPVIRMSGQGARESAMLRWGLVPAWAKDPSVGSRMINARSESAAQKPAFREALRVRRCAVPASGFYEWTGAPRHRIPHALRVEGEPLVAFAGLWERWLDVEGRALETFTILTTAANERVARLHDRMPAILAPREVEAWIAGTPQEAARLLQPYPADVMSEHSVSRSLNDSRIEPGRMPGADPAPGELWEDEPPQG